MRVTEELRGTGHTTAAEGGELRLSAPPGVLTTGLRDVLGRRKSEILEYLQGPAELSFSQQRLWLIDQIAPGGGAYVISGAVELSGMLDVGLLEQALRALVDRHESLRTIFPRIEGHPRQVVSAPEAWVLPIVDLSGEQHPRERLRQLLCEEVERGFDLAHGPLFRAQLYRLTADAYVLLLTMHHIISDGWSLSVLIREMGEFYRGLLTRPADRCPTATATGPATLRAGSGAGCRGRFSRRCWVTGVRGWRGRRRCWRFRRTGLGLPWRVFAEWVGHLCCHQS